MGKAWDGWESPASFERWCRAWLSECLRVLKPGGHMLAFGGTRTWHRLAVAVEDAGFEIRDSIAWLYSQGFPKGKAQLKPAFEPVVVARKPLTGTIAATVLQWGTGALNIDGCRIEGRERADYGLSNALRTHGDVYGAPTKSADFDASKGRWPANVLLDGSQADALDAQSGISKDSDPRRADGTVSGSRQQAFGMGERVASGYGGEGGASRFFPTFRYEPKAPTAERPRDGDVAHPTVKPLDLMRWLVRLVTPPGGVVLDPFAGSGTTAEACIIEGFRCITIERESDYLPVIRARLGKPIQLDLLGGWM